MTGPLTPGVHGLVGDPGVVVAALEAAGWRVAVVAPARSTGQLYDGLSMALDLPGWFGRNLDALWDSLTDLDGPTALVLNGWSTYADARPERSAQVLDLLRERSTQDPAFLVVLAG